MGAGASTELTKDQLKEKYAEVRHRLYPQQQASVEALFESSENPAEILECVNKHLNDAEVPNMEYDTKPEFTEKHISLMSKHLTPEVFAEMKAAGATPKGYTISRAIQTGVMTPHLGVGITAGDEFSWEMYKTIFYPIIKGWHQFDPETQNHTSDLDASKLTMTEEQVRFGRRRLCRCRARRYCFSRRCRGGAPPIIWSLSLSLSGSASDECSQQFTDSSIRLVYRAMGLLLRFVQASHVPHWQ